MNNSSYEQYIINGLEALSSNFNIKTYKLANQEEWPGFERGKDIRIQIRWKNKCIWEWITEKSFWHQINTNKEDRQHMRKHADIKIEKCKNAIIKKKTTPLPSFKTGNTQKAFEKMKSK